MVLESVRFKREDFGKTVYSPSGILKILSFREGKR